MADLNLDGLPVLTTLTTEAGIECNVPVEVRLQVIAELSQLVERERLEASEDADAESKERWELFQRTSKAKWRLQEALDKERERLPAWAKPVMRAAKRWETEYGSEELTPAEQALAKALFRLTEAQLKEIGDDDG